MVSESAELSAPRLIFTRTRVSPRDQWAFVAKLGIALALGAAGTGLVLAGHPLTVAAGVVVLGLLYTHLVELQHQCLHHSAFLAASANRRAGVVLGLPMLVSYSHYRVRHLQHHRYLGTDQDSEFFGFDTRKPLTLGALLHGMFDYRRFGAVAGEAWRSWRGTWSYEDGQVADRIRKDSMAEYRLMSVAVLAAAGAAAAGFGELVLWLWVAPVLLVATPLHFLVELPEHVRCDTDSTDVLRNTRSISGSWLSRWFTNGNNLHVEHHAAMTVPINRLPERHAEVRQFAKYVDHSYWTFYRQVARDVLRRPDGSTSHTPEESAC
ncbi:fatty acid desaturase family protein [Streptomyces cyaneofuscatus]|uniref:fatty acid desaturase family protein n=1 Tax=Streptomyces cyaneofuscatus TaxID=66883 RepID=UPI00367EC04E